MPVPMNALDGWMTLIVITICTIAVIVTIFAASTEKHIPVKNNETDNNQKEGQK